MPDNNVYVSIADPDSLIAGAHPLAPFAVSHCTLARFSSEANARAGASGTTVTEFVLIASTEERTEDEGPFRFGYYDSAQTSNSWYAYRFRDSGSLNFSTWSAPWQPGSRSIWTLRDLVTEVCQVMGIDGIYAGTATAGSATQLTCAALFKSGLRGGDYWIGSHLWISASTDGAAPEDEEVLISGVDVTTGAVYFDREVSTAVASGDQFKVIPLVEARQVKLAINLVRRQMKTLAQQPIAMDLTSTGGNRHALPQGVYTKSDITRCRWWSKSATADWEYLTPDAYDVEFDGNQAWLITFGSPVTDILMVEHKITYAELEGPLTDLDQVTKANIQWLAKAAAWWLYSQIDLSEAAEGTFARLAGLSQAEVRALTTVHEPSVPQPLNTGKRHWVGPVGAPI